jgi:hypothetical protein
MVREPDATMQPTPHDNQLMSKHRVLSLKPHLRLEWRGQDGQNETEQPDHSASLGDFFTSSTRIRFSVQTAGHSIFQNSRALRGPDDSNGSQANLVDDFFGCGEKPLWDADTERLRGCRHPHRALAAPASAPRITFCLKPGDGARVCHVRASKRDRTRHWRRS